MLPEARTAVSAGGAFELIRGNQSYSALYDQQSEQRRESQTNKPLLLLKSL
jgi:hypothetical protein